MFGLIEFLVEEFLDDIVDAVGDAIGAIGEAFSDTAADAATETASGASAPVAESFTAPPTETGFVPGGFTPPGDGGSWVTQNDGGIAADRFDFKPEPGAYDPSRFQ